MAKFVYVFRGGAVLEKGLSATALQDHLKLWGAWMGELAKQGHQPAGQRVQRGGRTIRGKSKVVTDGPYAELKDLVTGHLAIEAASLDVATELARECPIFLFDGSVEVRPVAEMHRDHRSPLDLDRSPNRLVSGRGARPTGVAHEPLSTRVASNGGTTAPLPGTKGSVEGPRGC